MYNGGETKEGNVREKQKQNEGEAKLNTQKKRENTKKNII